MAKNFIEVFQDECTRIKMPIPVESITLATEPLNSVAKGRLVAAALGDGA